MIIYLGVTGVFAYSFLKERAMLGCPMFYGECDNKKAKPLGHTEPKLDDNFNQLTNKLERASQWTKNTVYWRRAYMISVLVLLIFIWVFYSRFPSERELLLGVLILFATLCISFNFYQFHLNGVAEDRILDITNQLRDTYRG